MGMTVYEAIRRRGVIFDAKHPDLALNIPQLRRDEVMYGIMSAVRVNCQNIADLEFSGGAPALRDMPGAISPWPVAWFEFRSADSINLAGLVFVERVSGEQMSETAAHIYSATNQDNVPGPNLPGDAFMHTLYTFMDMSPHGHAPLLMGWSHWFAHPNGDPVLNSEGRFIKFYQGTETGREPSQLISRVVGLSCVFANCKNVALVEDGGKWPSRQARRAAERRGEEPPVTFHTLRINPNAMRKQGDAVGASSGRELSLHIVRGHFATYTEERPLFGKYAGTFWVPAHVRGSQEVGIVGKDYEITGAAA